MARKQALPQITQFIVLGKLLSSLLSGVVALLIHG